MKNQANKYLSLLIVNYPLHAKHSSNQEPILCGDKGNKRLAVAQNGIQELVDSQRNSSLEHLETQKCLWKIAGLMEDLFLGSQWSIILGYRRLSVKFLFSSLSFMIIKEFPRYGSKTQ